MSDTTSNPYNPYQAPAADLNARSPDPGPSGTIEDALAGRYDFAIGDVLYEAWKLTPGMKGTFWRGAVPLYLAYLLAAVVGGVLYKNAPVMRVLFNLFLGAVAPVLFLGLVAMGVRRAAGLGIAFATAFCGLRKALPAFIAGLLTTLLTYVGLALLLLPGIYLAIAYCMTFPLIADRDFAPWQALETSRQVVSKHWFKYCGLLGMMGLLVGVSAVPLGIGLIWTVPWAANVLGVAYRRTFGIVATA
jgi:uncharacterized membrane protein